MCESNAPLTSKMPIAGFEDRLFPSKPPPLGPAVDLLIHCNLIRTCCNAIQTLLQLNSNNSKGLWEGSIFCSAV